MRNESEPRLTVSYHYASEAPYTVDALDALSPGIVASLLLPANKATLIDILTYHVFDGSVLSPAAIA